MRKTPSNSTVIGNVTTGATSTLLLAENPLRRYVALSNDSDRVIYLTRGVAAEMNKGIRLNPEGAAYEIDDNNLYLGPIYGICEDGGKNVCFEEDSRVN